MSIAAAATAVELTTVTNSCNSSIKVLEFLLLAKTKNQLRKSLILSKTFPYLLNFPLTNSNLVMYLALYKEDQATH